MRDKTARRGTCRALHRAERSGVMRPAACCIVLICLLLSGAPRASAQYYSWGNSPASIRWNSIKTPEVKLIYPCTFDENARRVLYYLDTIRPHIKYGYTKGNMPTPVVLHTENMSGNGMVMWAPKRIELLSAPSSTYSEPWLKQLAIHEYRHNVQYNNLNSGTIRVLGWFLGQQIKFLGPGMFSLFFLEGDAVMAETEASAFGRGMQPSFTMHYRAVGDVGSPKYSKDFWFCGSFKEYVPDHYHLGYQMVRWSYDHYGEFIFDKTARYVARNPQFIFPMAIALRKYYGSSEYKLFKGAFDELNSYWASLPEVDDSSDKIDTPITSYTTYEWPLWIDGKTIAVFKKDLDRPSRIVTVDAATGREKVAAYTGIVSSRPVWDGRRLLWTEYRTSTLWEERVNSQLCWLDLETGRKGVVRSREQLLFPVATGSGDVACVVYDYTGRFSVRRGAAEGETLVEMPFGTELTGLAWDNATRSLYFIGLDDGGMWLGRIGENGSFERLTPSRHVTLSDLRASDGKLWFGSIVSGKDEAHCYDIAAGKEYRLTTSKYGSFQPSPDPSGTSVALTTYDRNGYKLAVQQAAGAVEQAPRELPVNLVNPDWRRWDGFPLMDSLVFKPSDLEASEKSHRAKRYRKGLNLFNFHSWLPLDFYPPAAIEEMKLDMNLGATVMSQSLLSDMTSWFGYGWNRRGGSSLKGGLSYTGLGPHIDVGVTWGGANQALYTLVPAGVRLKKYFSVNTRLSLPMVLGSGYNYRALTPAVEYFYTNGLVFKFLTPFSGELTSGVSRLNFSLTYAQQTRMATRDLLPRWGFAVRGSYIMNPADRNFRPLYSLFGRAYTPGILPHHSTTLRVNWQETLGDIADRPLMFHMKELIPRGALYIFQTRRWAAGSLDYQFPVWYPDGGIASIIYFKRLRLNLFADYARWQADDNRWHPLYSYGGDIILDFAPLRMPAASTMTAKLTIAKPSDRRGVAVMFGISVPL